MDAAALGRRSDAGGESRGHEGRSRTRRFGSSWSRRGSPHRCTIDLATGTAVVTRGDDELGRWETPIKGPGRYQRRVRQRRRPCEPGRRRASRSAARESNYESSEAVPIPTAADLAPAAIAVRNASVVASDLVLKRDIYYTQYPGRLDYGIVWEDRYPRTPDRALRLPRRIPPGSRVSPT